MIKRFSWLPLLMLSMSAMAGGMDDDPILTMFKLDKLEQVDVGSDNDLAWDAQAWLGHDIDKLWLKSEGKLVDGSVDDAELQLLYSHAVSAYWDVQLGLRHDIKPEPNRDWLAMSLYGLSPYFFETDISMFVGEKGNINLRTKFEYEVLLTQKWVLTPEIEANVFSQSDREHETGSGLADITTGLRLRYEVSRQFAPYIGWQWSNKYGETADFIGAEGNKTSDSEWVAGVRLWW